MQKISKLIISGFFITTFIISSYIFAGSVLPDNPPASTGHTITDIYNLIHNNNFSSPASHNLYPSTSPAATSSYSISQIYADLANLIKRESVATGTVYLNITGDYGNPDPAYATTTVISSTLTPDLGAVQGNAYGYSLEDIWNLIDSNATTTAGAHDSVPGGAPAGSMHTLSDIYDALVTLGENKASSVAVGTIYLGAPGGYVRPPEEVAEINLATVFPAISFQYYCNGNITTRSAVFGPYPYNVILRSKTALSADDYLEINNDGPLPVTGTHTCNGHTYSSGTVFSSGVDISAVSAGNTVTIKNTDTVGVSSSASGTISVMRVF